MRNRPQLVTYVDRLAGDLLASALSRPAVRECTIGDSGSEQTHHGLGFCR